MASTSRTEADHFRFESHRFILNFQTRQAQPPSQLIADFARPDLARGMQVGMVTAAEARGDFEVLVERHRRALRVHLGANVSAGLKTLEAALTSALRTRPEAG